MANTGAINYGIILPMVHISVGVCIQWIHLVLLGAWVASIMIPEKTNNHQETKKRKERNGI